MQLEDMEGICCELMFSLKDAPINHSAFEERSQRKSLLSGATAAKNNEPPLNMHVRLKAII